MPVSFSQFVRALMVAFVVSALLISSALARPACKSSRKAPQITVQIKPGTVKVDNSRSRQHLERLKSRGSTLTPANGWRPVGLTSTELGFSMRLRVNAKPNRKGSYCGYLDSVRASLGYDQLVVYIASKYRPGSCHYRSIMEHEKLHVLVFRRTLQRFSPRLNRRLKTAAANQRAVVAPNADLAAAEFKKRLRREVQPLFKEMNRELNRANAKLDTPANYKREQARCNNW